jgi:hypothetical protein
MTYSILLAPPAERQLKALAPPIQKRLVKRLKALRENPRPQGVKNWLARIIYIAFETVTIGHLYDSRQGADRACAKDRKPKGSVPLSSRGMKLITIPSSSL